MRRMPLCLHQQTSKNVGQIQDIKITDIHYDLIWSSEQPCYTVPYHLTVDTSGPELSFHYTYFGPQNSRYRERVNEGHPFR